MSLILREVHQMLQSPSPSLRMVHTLSAHPGSAHTTIADDRSAEKVVETGWANAAMGRLPYVLAISRSAAFLLSTLRNCVSTLHMSKFFDTGHKEMSFIATLDISAFLNQVLAFRIPV